MTGTDGADGAIAPRVIAGAVASARRMPGLSKYKGAINGAITGLFLTPGILLAIVSLTGESSFILSNWITIVSLVICAMINGALIGFLCRNRSDRPID